LRINLEQSFGGGRNLPLYLRKNYLTLGHTV
jgi:hypothetical protein